MTERAYLLIVLTVGLGFFGVLVTALAAIFMGRPLTFRGRARLSDNAEVDSSISIDESAHHQQQVSSRAPR